MLFFFVQGIKSNQFLVFVNSFSSSNEDDNIDVERIIKMTILPLSFFHTFLTRILVQITGVLVSSRIWSFGREQLPNLFDLLYFKGYIAA